VATELSDSSANNNTIVGNALVYGQLYVHNTANGNVITDNTVLGSLTIDSSANGNVVKNNTIMYGGVHVEHASGNVIVGAPTAACTYTHRSIPSPPHFFFREQRFFD
jgi:hypothetical protein